jgi:hypothetical protein
VQFGWQVLDRVLARLAFQFALQAAQGQANHVAMMQVAAGSLGEFEPQLVQAVQILRPQPRRVWTQVYVSAGRK